MILTPEQIYELSLYQHIIVPFGTPITDHRQRIHVITDENFFMAEHPKQLYCTDPMGKYLLDQYKSFRARLN